MYFKGSIFLNVLILQILDKYFDAQVYINTSAHQKKKTKAKHSARYTSDTLK